MALGASFQMKRKVRGFVFVDAEPGKEREIANRLMELDEVKEAHVVPGEHDLMIVLEIEREIIARTSEKLMKFVTDVIRATKGVRDTETIMPMFSLTKFQESV